MRNLLSAHLAALALRDDFAARSSRGIFIALCAIQLAGLAAFWRYEHQPIWLAVPTIALFFAFPFLMQLIQRRRLPHMHRRAFGAVQVRRRFNWAWEPNLLGIETLAPLFFLYAILAARYVAIRVLFASEPYVDEASLADPRLVFFQVEIAALVTAAYVALAQIARYARPELRPRIWVGVSGILLMAALGWFAAETIGHRTRGVTATDPYAYAQMAVDLATRGTPLHSFPLFKEIANEKIAWYPIQHLGYRLFDNLSGDAPTVWPIGGSIWIAAFYRVLGEEGLYLATPIAALLSLIAVALLSWEYFREQSLVTRAVVVATSVALLATSWEMVDRSIVPLVDAEAQLFTTLTVLFTFYALRSRCAILFGILTGLSLALAYHIRHTQVLIAIPILLGSLRIRGRERWQYLAAAALSALVVASPDLYYHHVYFGGWLTPESNELSLFSLSYFIPSMFALSERFFAGNEFGYLIPFLVYGIYRAARENAWKFSVLASWILVLVVFHLPYVAIKMRDLLPEFPAVIMLTAYGMFALARDVRGRVIASDPKLSEGSRGNPQANTEIASSSSFDSASLRSGRFLAMTLLAFLIFFTLLLPSMRTRLTILRPFQPVKITFGYVTAAQRASFDQIAALTPRDAVIASVMNDGPIDLYAQRATFRAGVWTPSERDAFIAAMKRAGREIFLLEDGAEVTSAKKDLETRYWLKQIATLDVPLFGETDLSRAVLWEIMP